MFRTFENLVGRRKKKKILENGRNFQPSDDRTHLFVKISQGKYTLLKWQVELMIRS